MWGVESASEPLVAVPETAATRDSTGSLFSLSCADEYLEPFAESSR